MNSTDKPWPAEWSEPVDDATKHRWRSTTIAGRAPGQSSTDPNYIRPMQQPTWEGSKVYEERPGGFRVPMVHASSPSQPVTAKQYANNRGGYDKQRKRLKHDPNIFKD